MNRFPHTPNSTAHVLRMLASHLQLTGRPLLERLPGESDAEIAARLSLDQGGHPIPPSSNRKTTAPPRGS